MIPKSGNRFWDKIMLKKPLMRLPHGSWPPPRGALAVTLAYKAGVTNTLS